MLLPRIERHLNISATRNKYTFEGFEAMIKEFFPALLESTLREKENNN